MIRAMIYNRWGLEAHSGMGGIGGGELEELAPTGAAASWDELFWPWRATATVSLEYGLMLKIEEWEGSSVGLD